MSGNRRNPIAIDGRTRNGDVMVLSGSQETTSEEVSVREKLRHRWELASVLNFLNVFKPLIKIASTISAEDVETALVEQNDVLTRLHISLLEGILPGNRTLKGPDTWMITLSKTLVKWWPWVAEGDFPLTAAKGKEISTYRELDPTTRLFILKALCEVRAEQPDAVAYINDAIKDISQLSNFRKDKLAGSGNEVTFWYDGNETIGHRLYKEVHLFESEKIRGKGVAPAFNCEWETLATNLEEFKEVVSEFSSSKVKREVMLSKAVEADILPVLEKYWKKKEKAQLRLQRDQMRLSGFRNSGIARSCRNQKPVDYRFDNYDKAIAAAIQYANKRKIGGAGRKEEKRSQSGKRAANGSYNFDTNLRDGESTESDSDMKSNEQSHDGDDPNHEEYGGESEDDRHEEGNRNHQKVQTIGSRFSKRLAGVPGHTLPESMNLVARNRLKQRPSVNTAAESIVVPDSEDEMSSGDME